MSIQKQTLSKSKPQEMGFTHRHVIPIKGNSKTSTYRLGNKYAAIEAGDKIQAIEIETSTFFAELEITEKRCTTFKDLPTNSEDHENYSSKDEQREIFERYYGRDIKDSDEMLVFSFRVVRLIE